MRDRQARQGGTPCLMLSNGVLLDLPSQESWVLGRSTPERAVDVDLTPFEGHDYGVSRVHARLMRRTAGGFAIEDLASCNGTYLDDARLAAGQRYELVDGDRLTLGKLHLVFVSEGGTTAFANSRHTWKETM